MAHAIRQQAINSINVDPILSHHMASLGHKELINWNEQHSLLADILMSTFSNVLSVKKIVVPVFWLDFTKVCSFVGDRK